ncbi:hypothetical protein PYCCODRAFT_201796 [Trametes coccinea BRFM310]|uniref:Uncharacterized protein n=1 Tax=Trametes coccinea (strain BRFM310) TaxID=1353009 RepID=A0A1Y2IRS7_TRAC3|nr:hypothetical protein PYCCODRAFT_201796 [Trametes coccinea BRFM310]
MTTMATLNANWKTTRRTLRSMFWWMSCFDTNRHQTLLPHQANMSSEQAAELVATYQSLFTNNAINIAITGATLELCAVAIPAVFSCLRVYALTGRNRWLSGCTLALGLIPMLTNMQ